VCYAKTTSAVTSAECCVSNVVSARPHSIAVSNLSQLARAENVCSTTSVWMSNPAALPRYSSCHKPVYSSYLLVVCAPISSVSQSKAPVTSNGSYCSEVAFRIGDKGLFDTDNDSPLRSASQLTVVSQSPQFGRRNDNSASYEHALCQINGCSVPSERERCMSRALSSNRVYRLSINLSYNV